jgi:hypothetical protein
MSRFYEKIHLADFKFRIDKLFLKYANDYEFTTQIETDLSKVEFDRENITTPNDELSFGGYPVGHMTIGNDLHVYFTNAGGDWEFPVCFIIYWDGKQLRAYIPEDGNVWNKKTKMAYGNEDGEDDQEELEKQVDKNLIINDILNRIKLK